MAGLSGSEREVLERAIDSLTLAFKQEKTGGHPDHQVLHHYCQGLTLLLPLLGSPSCSGRYRLILRRKCGDFLAKARHLQRRLRPLTPHPNPDSDPSVHPDVISENAVVSACSDVAAGNNDVMRVETRHGVFTHEKGLCSADPSAAATNLLDVCIPSPTNLGDVPKKEETGSGVGVGDNDDHHHPHETGQKKRERTREINCEVGLATVEVDCSEDSDREEEEEKKKKKEEEKKEEKKVEAVRSAMLQAEEVMGLARQFFSEEELEGQKKTEGEKDKEDEALRQQRLVQDLLDTVFQNQHDVDDCDTWVKAPGMGLDDLQMTLKERIILPLSFPRLLGHGVTFSPCMLLYGRPGDGMLPLLRHLNKAWPTYIYPVCAHWLLEAVTSGTVNERDLIRALFSRALQSAPCALCITDFEAVVDLGQYAAGSGHEDMARRLKTELLVHMEQLRRHRDVVVFVAVTSRPWLIEPPVRRKMVYRCYCPPPTPQERMAVFLESLKHVRHCLSQGDLRHIAEKTSLFSRTDMRVLADESHAMLRLRVQEAEYFKPVSSSPPCASSVGSSAPDLLPSTPPSSSSLRDEEEENHGEGYSRESIHEEPTARPHQEIETEAGGGGGGGGGGDPQTEEREEPCRKLNGSCMEAEETTQGTEFVDQEKDKSDHEPFRFVQRAAKTSEGAENFTDECNRSSKPGTTNTTSATCDFAEEQCSFDDYEQKRGFGDREMGGSMTNNSENDTVSDEEDADCEPQQPHSSSAEYQADDAEDATTEADNAPESIIMYTPCQSDDADSVPMTWLGMQAHRLQEPDMTYCDVLRAIRHKDVEFHEDDVRRLRAWHENFGSL